MALYEVTLVAKHDMSDADREKIYNKVEEKVSERGGAIKRYENWGVMPAIKPIGKYRKVMYLHFIVAVGESFPQEMKKIRKVLSNFVFRVFVIKNDKADLESLKEGEISLIV